MKIWAALALLHLCQSNVVLDSAPPARPAEEQTPAAPAEPEPPPSAYDLVRERNGEDPVVDSERSLLGQLLRTVLALGIVVGLIYLLSRFGLQRILNPRVGGSGGRLRLLERLPVDGRQALLLVRVEEHTFLLATGEGGVRLLTEVASRAPASSGPSFGEVLRAEAVENLADKQTSKT